MRAQASASGSGTCMHQVAARGEGAVDRLREIAGRDEQQVRVRLGEDVELHQHRVGRAVDVDGIGFQAHLGAVGGERLDLVEQHDGRARRPRPRRSPARRGPTPRAASCPSPNW